MFDKPDTCAATVLVDEFDAGSFKRAALEN